MPLLGMVTVVLEVWFRSQHIGDLFLRTRRDGLVDLDLRDGGSIRAGDASTIAATAASLSRIQAMFPNRPYKRTNRATGLAERPANLTSGVVSPEHSEVRF